MCLQSRELEQFFPQAFTCDSILKPGLVFDSERSLWIWSPVTLRNAAHVAFTLLSEKTEKQESWRTIQWTSLQWSLHNALGNVLRLACTGPAPFLDHNDASAQPRWGRISEQEWNVNIYTYKHFKYFSFCPVPQLWGFRALFLEHRIS